MLMMMMMMMEEEEEGRRGWPCVLSSARMRCRMRGTLSSLKSSVLRIGDEQDSLRGVQVKGIVMSDMEMEKVMDGC